MVQIHIVTKDEKTANELTVFLVSERLILDAFVIKGVKHFRNAIGTITKENHFLVLGKTKALLFNQIDKLIREKYEADMPTLYSVPIVDMDWDQSAELREKTEKI